MWCYSVANCLFVCHKFRSENAAQSKKLIFTKVSCRENIKTTKHFLLIWVAGRNVVSPLTPTPTRARVTEPGWENGSNSEMSSTLVQGWIFYPTPPQFWALKIFNFSRHKSYLQSIKVTKCFIFLPRCGIYVYFPPYAWWSTLKLNWQPGQQNILH